MIQSALMSADEVKRKLIENGLWSIEQDERLQRAPHKLEGSREGFNLCYDLHTPQDFEKCLTDRQEEQEKLRRGRDSEAYWRHRFATIQIEAVWESMKILWRLPGPKSTQAALRLAKAIGIA